MANDKELKSLEAKITAAIKSISDGNKTPQESGIGRMFKEIKALDEPAYEKLLADYRPVSEAFFETFKQSASEVAARKKRVESELAKIALSGGRGGDLSDMDLTKGPSGSAREKAVKLKNKSKPMMSTGEKGERDRTAFQFEGQSYGKGQLVLAILRKHVADNPNATHDQLKKSFPDELLKGYGIFQSYEKAAEISKVRRRFFLKDEQLVRIKGGSIAICNQFSTENIKPFLAHAVKMGFKFTGGE